MKTNPQPINQEPVIVWPASMRGKPTPPLPAPRERKPKVTGTPYFIDRTESGYLFGCRSCNWTTITPTDEQPDHRCGQGDCIHKGEARGTVKVECCSGTEKLLQAHACALHGRCLPGFVNHAAGLKKWEARKPESDLYKLCCICPNRQDVNTHTVSETLVQ